MSSESSKSPAVWFHDSLTVSSHLALPVWHDDRHSDYIEGQGWIFCLSFSSSSVSSLSLLVNVKAETSFHFNINLWHNIDILWTLVPPPTFPSSFSYMSVGQTEAKVRLPHNTVCSLFVFLLFSFPLLDLWDVFSLLFYCVTIVVSCLFCNISSLSLFSHSSWKLLTPVNFPVCLLLSTPFLPLSPPSVLTGPQSWC